MKRLYATVDPEEAQTLRTLLRDQGIESTLGHEGGGVTFGLPTDEASIAINVRDEDAAAAAEALARHFEKRDAEEAAPEAPEPPSPEESAAFEAKVKRRSSRWRFWELVIYFLPGIGALMMLFELPWQMVVGGAAGVLSIVALIWVLDLIAENKKGPPPDAGDGPVQKSS